MYLSRFGLANLPTSAIISAEIADFFSIVGGIAVIVFALALLYLGFKALFKR